MNLVTDRVAPDVAVLALEGELDAANHRDLVDAGAALYADGVRRLVLDLAELGYMSSSGIVALHSLVLVYSGHPLPDLDAPVETTSGTGAAATGGVVSDAVRLVAPQPVVQRGLKRTGFLDILRVYPDRAAALA